MVQIIDEKPGFGQMAAHGLNKGIEGGLQAYIQYAQQERQKQQQQKQSQQLQSLLGKDLSGINPELQKVFVQEILKSQANDPAKMKQQSRLFEQELRTKYGQRIKEEIASLKETFDPNERKAAGQRIRQLQSERDELLGFEFDEMLEDSKMKFDPQNPEHIKKFEQLDKKFKGDRKKVNATLAREFTL